MASEAETPEPLSIMPKIDEEKDPTSRQFDKSVDKYCQEELKKVECIPNQPPETIKHPLSTDTMQGTIHLGVESNARTLESERFLELPSVANNAVKETCRISEHHQADEIQKQAEKEVSENITQLQKDQKFEGGEKMGSGGNEVMEARKEKAEKGNDSLDIANVIEHNLQKSMTEEPALKIVGEDNLKNERILDQNVEIIEQQQASPNVNARNTEEATSGSHKDEKQEIKIDDSESSKQCLNIIEATSDQNKEALENTPDLTVMNRDVETVTGACDEEKNINNTVGTKTVHIQEQLEETIFKEGEDKKPKKSFNIAETKNDLEAIKPSEKTTDEKYGRMQIPHDGTRGVSMSTLTGNPDIKNDEEATSVTRECAIDKIDSASAIIGDEIQGKNLDTPFVIQTEETFHKVKTPEIFNKVSEIRSENDVKESPKEAEEQAKIIEETTQTYRNTSKQGKDGQQPEQRLEDSFTEHEKSTREDEGLETTEASARGSRNEEKITVAVTEENASNTEIVKAEEHGKKETSKPEEKQNHSFLQHEEPKKEKLQRSSNVISEMMETSASSEDSKTIACIKKERSIRIPEDSFKEMEKEDKPTDTDDISEHVIPKEKNISPVALNETIESADLDIPEKNVNDLQGNLLIVENEQLEHEKQDEVSKFEPQKQVNEANGVVEEKPNEGEKTEIVEKTVQADSNTSEQGKDGESAEQKLDSPFTEYEKSVNSDGEGQTTTEASAGKKVHEEQVAVVVAEESISNAEIVEAAKNGIKETSEHKEEQDQSLLHQEPNKEEVQRSLNVIPEMMETPALSENAETITCIKEKRSTKNFEESFEDIKKEVKQTDCCDNSKPEIPKEKNFPPVDLNEKIKSEDLQIPEKNVNDLHVIDSLVEKTEQVEHKKLELQEQVNEPNEAVKESPNVEQQTEINEKIFQAHSTTSEPGEDSENPEQKPEESMQREGDRVPTTEASTGINRDENKLTVVVTEENSRAENVESRENSEKDTSIHEEEQDHIFLQHEEPEKEELQIPLKMISGMMEKPASSENVETITSIKEEKSITILEDSFGETEEEGKPTDTGDNSKHIITKEKNLPPGDLNEKIESEDLRIPERNVNDLLVTESLVEETEQEEHEKLDEISKFESKEQVNEHNEAVKESPNEVEQQTEITEKIFQARSIESGPGQDSEKPEKSMQREDDRVPTMEASAGVNRDEDKLTVVVPEENSSAENVESRENIEKDTLKHEEEHDQRFLQHEEPEKERQRPLNMISEIMEKPASSEHVETITCTEEERSIKILEDSFEETEEGKPTDAGDISEHIITKEKNLQPVDLNEKIESEDLQIPEKNVNDLLVIDSLVEETEQVENEKMDEISKFEPQQQNNEPNEAVKESLNEVEHQTEITEKIFEAQSITSEPGEDSNNPEQKPAESIQRERDRVPTTEASTGISKDEEKLTVLVPEKNSSAEKVESRENSKRDTLKHEEQQDVSFLQHGELEKGELQRPLKVISEMMEKPASSENVETITCVKEEKSIKILEDSFEETEEEDKPTDTRDISEHIITKEKNLPRGDLNEKIETEDLRIPEKNVNDLLVIDSLVEDTEQEEHERLDEISKFEPQEQVYEPNEAVEESPNEVEQQTETEKICQPHSIASEPGEDSENPEQKPEESMQREDDRVPTTETSAGINRDEDKLTVAVPEENSSAENVKSRENSKKDILKHEEEQDQRFLQHEEPKKELQRPLNMISEMMGKPASSENVETITCVEEERSIKILEDSFDETEEGKLTDTGDVSEHIITKEKNLPPVDFNKKIESEDLRTPEKNVNDLLVIDSLVEETEQVEHEKMDEISKFEPQQQVNEPNEAVKESPNEVEQQTEITEKICQAQSITSEPGEDSENPVQNPEESIQREGDRVPTTEASAGINRDEEKLNVVVPEENSSAEKVESRENSKKDTLKHKEQQDQSFLQHEEPEKEELQRPLNMISEMMEKPASSENVETITCVKEKKSIKILEDSFEETKEEDKPTDTGDISEHIITKAKNLPPVNLKEKTESEDTEIPEKNVNDLHVTNSLVEETEPKQDEKLDDSKFEPREKLNEANGASTEEERKIEEKSAAGKSEESTTLEHTSTEGKSTKDLISIPEQKYSEKLQYIGRLDFEEEEVKDVGENTEVEIKKNEAAFDTGMDNKPTKSDSTESLIEEDAPINVCSTVREVDEKDEKSSIVVSEVAKELSGDDKNCKADGQINNIIDEEVHDEQKIRVMGDVTKEHIVEGNVRYISPVSNEEETAESFQDTEKETEESKLEDTREQIIEEGNIDLPPESAKEGPVKNFKDDEKETEKLDKEILKESETAEAGDKNAHEKNQENEIPEKIFYTSPVKQKERLQGESEDLPLTDASGTEEKTEDRSSFMVTDDEDNITGLVEAKENSKKLEKSLNMMSEETGVCVSNEDISLREEAAVENLEEALGEEMKEEEEAKDNDGTKDNGIAKEEDREQVTEASEENKSPECTVLELNLQEREIEVETLKAGSELDSKGELEGMEVSKNIEEEIVETNGASREKSKIMEVAIANDSSTVYTGKAIEQICQEDENTQKSTEGAENKLKPGDQSYKTDNEIENLKEVYESSEIIGMGEDAAKRIIDEECTVIDISPQPIGEVMSKSSENDVKKEETPKVEMCEKHETTSLDDSTQKQNLEERGITTEENSRVNEHVIKKEHTVTEISPELIEEETFKSSEEDVKEEKKPKVEMHEESEVTSVDESLQKQTLEEENTIRNWSVGSARGETNEQSSIEDEHAILEEHIVTDSSQESTGEEMYKSSEENEKNEEKPKVEKCAEFEKTIVDEGIQKQILEEENGIKSRYIEVDRAKTDEESFKKDKHVKQDKHTVTTISPNSIPEETYKSTEEEEEEEEEGNLKVENLESAAPDDTLENSFESNTEDQYHNPLPKTNQTQIEKIKNITYQNTGDVGKREMNEEVKPQMEAQDHKETKNETISDDILTDKVSRSPEADENENIKEQIIQEGSDTKELHETYVRDETDKEITEKKKAIDELHAVSLSEETIKKIPRDDEPKAEEYTGEKTNEIFIATKNEIQEEEVAEETEKTDSSNNIIENIAHDEERACAASSPVSVKKIIESLPSEARGKNVEEAAIKLNMENQEDTANTKDGKIEPMNLSKEEQIEISRRETERSIDEAKIHNTICENEIRKTQDQTKADDLAPTQYSGLVISQNEGGTFHAKDKETTQEIQKPEETFGPISEKQAPREVDTSELTEMMVSSDNKGDLLSVQDLILKSIQKAEAKDLKLEIASGTESDLIEEPNKESASINTEKISLPNLLQRSPKETLQKAGQMIEEEELTTNKEEMKTEGTTLQLDEAKTDEEKDEEDGEEEHKKEDSGSDAPIMVEASKEMDVKVSHKKSHNILSGVGSKVKHSIAKVKKAIIGKSSHPKPSHPKPVSPKEMK